MEETMTAPEPTHTMNSPRRSRRIALGAAAVALLAGALAAVAVAVASSGTLTVGSAANGTLKKTVVINASGRTLYSLTPETTHHLLCTTKMCLSVWPPLTVRSKSVKLKDGSGVHGTLSLVKRPNGVWQVALRGKPLYRFTGDEAKGEANGEGIKADHGTWHAATASAAAAPTSPPAETPSKDPSPPVYGY
jgi:predicted lipoprotein with Yx(FWY)xxD motif